LLRKAVVVHVARGDEAVIGGNRQPERHLVPARQTSRMACAALVPKISKTTPCKVAWRSLACAIPRRQFDTFTCNIPSSRNL
jgi:BarA-like signal transduction histidine kinase